MGGAAEGEGVECRRSLAAARSFAGIISVVRVVVEELFVAILLTLCVGIYTLELSGRWDRTFQDSNDEAGLVAVVLCIGVAVSVAATVLNLLLPHKVCRGIRASRLYAVWISTFRFALPVCNYSPPPLPLRI